MSCTSGPLQTNIQLNPVASSHVVRDSARTAETSGTFHISDSAISSQDVSKNSGNEKLTLDDYMEAQKYAKYAVSALSYEDSETAIESMMKALTILKK